MLPVLSAVAGLIVHLLSFSFEGKYDVVRGSLILAGLLAPPMRCARCGMRVLPVGSARLVPQYRVDVVISCVHIN